MATKKLPLLFRSKMYAKIFLVLIVCLMQGCEESEEEGYIPFPYGVGPSDYSVNLGNGYELHRSSASEIGIDPIYAIKDSVPSKVVSLAWNDLYILAVQHPLTLRKSSASSYPYPNPDEEAMWIVETGKHKAYGPLSKEEYNEMLQKIGINPDEFKWRTPDETKAWGIQNSALADPDE